METKELKISERILTVENSDERKFLRKKTHEIDPTLFKSKIFQSELRHIITQMRLMMREANGVGLSANQVGIPYRFFVARAPQSDGKWKQYTYINPMIKKTSQKEELDEEGCLSVPHKFGPVSRAYALSLEGLNLQGKKVKLEAKGLLARICQHEIDHLDGVLFIDKAKYVEDVGRSKETPSI